MQKKWKIVLILIFLFILYRIKTGKCCIMAKFQTTAQPDSTTPKPQPTPDNCNPNGAGSPFDQLFCPQEPKPGVKIKPEENEEIDYQNPNSPIITPVPSPGQSVRDSKNPDLLNPTGFGIVYNAYCLWQESNLAPEGTRFPHKADLEELNNSIISETTKNIGIGYTDNINLLTPLYQFGENYKNLNFVGNGYRTWNGNFTAFLTTTILLVLFHEDHANYLTQFFNTSISKSNGNLGFTGNGSLFYGGAIRCLLTNPEKWSPGDIVKDASGNIYGTTKIGPQVWLTANLATTKFKDGTPIPVLPSNSDWINATTPAICYPNNEIDKVGKTSKLY